MIVAEEPTGSRLPGTGREIRRAAADSGRKIMEFEEREPSFEEAERRHADLERRRDAGQIDDRQFDDERRRLMVRDAGGRWWAKDREANEWYYYEEEPPWIVLGGDKPPVLPGEADGWYDYGWIYDTLYATEVRRRGSIRGWVSRLSSSPS